MKHAKNAMLKIIVSKIDIDKIKDLPSIPVNAEKITTIKLILSLKIFKAKIKNNIPCKSDFDCWSIVIVTATTKHDINTTSLTSKNINNTGITK